MSHARAGAPPPCRHRVQARMPPRSCSSPTPHLQPRAGARTPAHQPGVPPPRRAPARSRPSTFAGPTPRSPSRAASHPMLAPRSNVRAPSGHPPSPPCRRDHGPPRRLGRPPNRARWDGRSSRAPSPRANSAAPPSRRGSCEGTCTSHSSPSRGGADHADGRAPCAQGRGVPRPARRRCQPPPRCSSARARGRWRPARG